MGWLHSISAGFATAIMLSPREAITCNAIIHPPLNVLLVNIRCVSIIIVFPVNCKRACTVHVATWLCRRVEIMHYSVIIKKKKNIENCTPSIRRRIKKICSMRSTFFTSSSSNVQEMTMEGGQKSKDVTRTYTGRFDAHLQIEVTFLVGVVCLRLICILKYTQTDD